MWVLVSASDPSLSRGVGHTRESGGDFFFKYLILLPGIGIWNPTSIQKHMLALALK